MMEKFAVYLATPGDRTKFCGVHDSYLEALISADQKPDGIGELPDFGDVCPVAISFHGKSLEYCVVSLKYSEDY